MPPQHGLEIEIRRPDPMHAMLRRETPVFYFDFFPAGETPAHAFIGFDDERLQPAFGKVKGGGEPRNPASDNDGFVVFFHWVDYI